ncbi:MAG TPA: CRISPR-associated protein Cas6 [Pelotomaculum sp.]|nr:CRISPR-associated protein Cas6 [Pelotomaculum sp.]
MDCCFYEVVSAIRFEKDVPMREVQSGLAGLSSQAMTFDEQLKTMHHQNRYKPYVFCAPYPLEPDRIYRKERMYCFHLRTRDLGFASAMKAYLPRAKGIAKVISIELRSYLQTHINELISLTPIISTLNNRCWMPENGIGLLADRIQMNAVKKCKAQDVSFVEPDELFFERIDLLNRKPVIVSYKGTSLLGHKVRLAVKPNAWAQRLAFIALSGGVCEKNAIGFGYCLAK